MSTNLSKTIVLACFRPPDRYVPFWPALERPAITCHASVVVKFNRPALLPGYLAPGFRFPVSVLQR